MNINEARLILRDAGYSCTQEIPPCDRRGTTEDYKHKWSTEADVFVCFDNNGIVSTVSVFDENAENEFSSTGRGKTKVYDRPSPEKLRSII